MTDALRLLSPTLINERGMGGIVCIWRKDDHRDSGRSGSVGEWLSTPEHQRGDWYIDGGWGGPPGPLVVRWDDEQRAWLNGGFCGHRFGLDVAQL